MAKRKKLQKPQMILGAVIGAAAGLGAVAFYHAAKKKFSKKGSALAFLEKALMQGLANEEGQEGFSSKTAKKNTKKVKSGHVELDTVLDLTKAGIQLWKQIR